MKRIIQIYDSLSSENRSSFWNVSCSFILAILTTWLGFTISFLVSDSNAKLQEKALMYQNQIHFSNDVDAFLKICAEIDQTTGRYIEPLSNLIEEDSFTPKDEMLILNSTNGIISYFESNPNLIDSLSNHLYLLSQCIEANDTKQIGLDLQSFFVTITLLSPAFNGMDNAQIKRFFETKHLNDPLSVRNKQYYYSKKVIDEILTLRKKIDEINNERGTALVKLMLVKQFILDPIKDIERIVRKHYVPTEEQILEHPFVKSLLLLCIIILLGFSLWYMLIPQFFSSMSNPYSSDDYRKLERMKNEIESNYKNMLAESSMYQIKIEHLEEKLENYTYNAKIEERYIWILSELAKLKNNEGIIQKQEIERILVESKEV